MMRSLVLAPMLLLATLPSWVAPQTSADGLSDSYDVSRAIVIGINRYHSPGINQLKFAAQDANEVAEELENDYGFEHQNVKRLIDGEATLGNIRKAIASLATAGANDRVVIYFAGHGATQSGVGFLLPVDADIDPNDDSSYLTTCLDMREVRNMLDLCKAKHVLILADACFSGFLGNRSAEIKPRAAAVLMRLTVREVITAGTKEEVSTEDPILGHGIFTYNLLEDLRAGARAGATIFTAENLFDEIFDAVVNRTDAGQKPQRYKIDGDGEFLFSGPNITPKFETPVTGDASTSWATMRFDVMDREGRPVPDPIIRVGDETERSSRKRRVLDLADRKQEEVRVAIYAPGLQPSLRHVTVHQGKELLVSVRMDASRVPAKIKTKVSAKGDVEMAYIPEGEFTMGDKSEARRVYLDAYWIGKDDVTVAQFRSYCKATGYKFDWAKQRPAGGWKGDHPVVLASWSQARGYCRWAGGDLPTEAQWEKAARGDDGRTYPWGDGWDLSKLSCSKAVTLDAKSTSPVGSHRNGASPYGCFDMAGNVGQWCLDWFGAVDTAATRDPAGPGSGINRVLRGGDWGSFEPGDFACANRDSQGPSVLYDTTGFRLATRR